MTNHHNLYASIAAQLGDVEIPTDVEDLSELNLLELTNRLEELDAELKSIGELLQTTTECGRELHSRRTAVIVALKTRKK